jgi:hypothetical protein
MDADTTTTTTTMTMGAWTPSRNFNENLSGLSRRRII